MRSPFIIHICVCENTKVFKRIISKGTAIREKQDSTDSEKGRRLNVEDLSISVFSLTH